MNLRRWYLNRGLPALIALILLVSFATSGCLCAARVNHYESNGLIFDFPSTWKLSPDGELPPAFSLPAKVVLLLQNDAGAGIALLIIEPGQGEKMEDLFQKAYLQLNGGLHSARNISQSTGMIGEKNVLFKSYELGWGEGYRKYEDSWIELDGRIFIFSLWSGVSQFKSYIADRDFILSSFRSTLAPFTPSPTPALGRFKGKDISFEYSGSFEIKTNFATSEEENPEFDAKRICSLTAQNPWRSVEVLEKKHTFGMKMKDFFRLYYLWREKSLIRDFSESSMNLSGGLDVLVKLYNRPLGELWYRFEDVWIETGSKIFILSFYCPLEKFEAFQEEIEQILNSLYIPLPSTETPRPTLSPTPSSSPTPTPLTSTPTSSITPSPPTTSTPTSSPTATPSTGILLTARAAFALVQPKVLEWSAEAQFVAGFAGVYQTGEPIYDDGTCSNWEFWFIKPGKKLIVSLSIGEITSLKEENYGGSYFVIMPENWIDSPRAIERAREELAKNHADAEMYHIANLGLLYQTVPILGKGNMATISVYFAKGNEYPYYVIIDASTGEFLHEGKM